MPGWQATQPRTSSTRQLPIVDAHHHLWNRGGHRYLLEEVLADTGSGHNIVARVFVECVADVPRARAGRDETIGEDRIRQRHGGDGGQRRLRDDPRLRGHRQPCRPVDGRCGRARIMERTCRPATGAFAASDMRGAWDASREIRTAHAARSSGPVRLTLSFTPASASWPAGPRRSNPGSTTRSCRLTAWRARFPGTGSCSVHAVARWRRPLRRQGRRPCEWKRDLQELARCPNACVKLGGLGMPNGMFDFHTRAVPATSRRLADAWRPWIEMHHDLRRRRVACSKATSLSTRARCSYAVLWNAFKRLAAGASAAQRGRPFQRRPHSACIDCEVCASGAAASRRRHAIRAGQPGCSRW